MADEPVIEGHLESRAWWRYVIGVGFGVLVLVLLFTRRGDFTSAIRQVRDADVSWLLAAVVVQASSLWLFTELQHHLLRVARTPLGRPSLFALTLANDAISNTVPGEPAVSSAYRYRFYRHRGASAASAGWTIFTTLISLAMGMALLVLLGVLVALASSSSITGAGAALVALCIVAASMALLMRRDLLLRGARRIVSSMARRLGHPKEATARRIEGALERMNDIPHSFSGLLSVAALGLAVWGTTFLCLVCSFKAVGAPIPWSGVLLAFGVAQIVGSIPLIPGGIGIVEGSLSVVLVAYGTARSSALAVALTYRLVNFWLCVIIGWIVVAVLASRRRQPEPSEAAG